VVSSSAFFLISSVFTSLFSFLHVLLFSGLVASRQLRIRDLIPRLKLNAAVSFFLFFSDVCGDFSSLEMVFLLAFCQTVAIKFN